MTKAEKLTKLDELVLDKMIDLVSNNKTDQLAELTTAVQYLKANQVIEPPKREGDPTEERKKKLEEVKKRREQVQ